jgi:hypothetical protein
MSWGRGSRKADKPYSQAFETFVKPEAEDEDDVIGLLAYALYKQAIREDAIAGNAMPGERRTPSDTTVQAYRGAARQLLTGVIDQAIADSTAAIQESALRDSVHAAEANIKAHLDTRTNWKAAVGTNLIAWLISLAIVFLVLVLFRAPEVTDLLVDAVNPKTEAEQLEPPAVSPADPARLPPPGNGM